MTTNIAHFVQTVLYSLFHRGSHVKLIIRLFKNKLFFLYVKNIIKFQLFLGQSFLISFKIF